MRIRSLGQSCAATSVSACPRRSARFAEQRLQWRMAPAGLVHCPLFYWGHDAARARLERYARAAWARLGLSRLSLQGRVAGRRMHGAADGACRRAEGSDRRQKQCPGKGSDKHFSRAVFVMACYGARRSLAGLASIAARKGRHRRRKAAHVPQRRNRAARADAPRRHRGPRRVAAGAFPNRCGRAAAARTSSEGRGQSGGGPAVSRPGPRRDATRRRLGPNTLAMPGAFPATAEGAWRRNRASGRCRQRHAAAAALGGSAKCVEGITQPGCESADPGRDGGLPITTQLPHARPASRGAAGSCRAPAASRGNPSRTPGA